MILEAITLAAIVLTARHYGRISDFIQDLGGMAGEKVDGELGDRVEAKLQKWCNKIADNIEKTSTK
jgi:hypothetical protein